MAIRQSLMTSLTSLLLAAFATCLATRAAAEELVSIGPQGAWVQHVDITDTLARSSDDTDRGERYQLVDWQQQVEDKATPSATQHFNRYAIELNSLDAVERESQVSIEFDPRYQRLTVHYLRVWRDGQVRDLTQSARYSLLDSDDGGESLLYYGNKNAHFVLEGVRVGDVLEYAYTKHGTNPVFSSHIEYNFATNWSTDVDRLFVRVSVPDTIAMQQREFGTPPGFSTTHSGGYTHYALDHKPEAHPYKDDSAPPWFTEGDQVGLSSVSDWGAVVDWALPMYEQAYEQPDALWQLAAEIKRQHGDDPDALAGAALQWVQDEVRYLGLEYGTNSHRPSPASESLRRRYGDCKDKTVLLLSLLNALGLSGHPALVNTESGHALPDQHRRLHAFDHVIAFVEVNGSHYWLDATSTGHRGPVSAATQPDFGHALIVAPGERALTDMFVTHTANGSVTVDTLLDLRDLESARLTVTTTSHQRAALNTRAFLDNNGSAYVEERYRDYTEGYYGALTLAAPTTFTELADGAIQTVEQYRLDNPSETLRSGGSFALYGMETRSQGTWPADDRQDQPLYLGRGRAITETLRVIFPESVSVPQAANTVEDRAFTLTTEQSQEADNTLLIKTAYQPLANAVAPHNVAAYESALNAASDALYFPLDRYFAPVVSSSTRFTQRWMEMIVIAGMVIIGVCWLIAGVLHVLGRSTRAAAPKGVYYPVSGFKFVYMNLMTFGLYTTLYFYRCFRYCRAELGAKLVPAIWALFSIFTFYSLYTRVKGTRSAAPVTWTGKLAAIALAIAYAALSVYANVTEYAVLVCLIAVPVLLLVREVNACNTEHTDVKRTHSRFDLRHALMVPGAIAIWAVVLVADLGLQPATSVRSGDQMWGFEQQYFDDIKVLNPNESVAYFYSNALLDFRHDGNGLTDKGMFSYWFEEDGSFNRTRMAWDDVTRVKIRSANGETDVTVVEATDKSERDITLFLASGLHCTGEVVRFIRERLPDGHHLNCA